MLCIFSFSGCSSKINHYSDYDEYLTQASKNTSNAKPNTKTSKKFISSLNDFNMTISYPYNISAQSKSVFMTACNKINQKYGCEIKYDFDNKSSAHIMYTDPSNLLKYIESNKICDLTSAINQIQLKFNKEYYNQQYTNLLNINYKQYGWVSDIGTTEMPNVIIFNKSLLKSMDIADFRQLCEQEEWTFDNLEKAIKISKDNDYYELSAIPEISVFESICASKNCYPIKSESGQSPTSNIDNSLVIQALKQLDNWYNDESVISKNNNSITKRITDFINGKSTMIFLNSKWFAIYSDMMKNHNSNDFAVVPFASEHHTNKYKNVCSPRFFAYIPIKYQSSASKILFLQNELYKALSKDCFTLFSNDFSSISKGSLLFAYNIKYSIKNNQTINSVFDIYESQSTIGTNSLVKSIAKGLSYNDAIEKYKNGIDNYYNTVLNDYICSGINSSMF